MRCVLDHMRNCLSHHSNRLPKWMVSSSTILGELHRLDNVPNQDAHFTHRFADVLAVAVFDGHGEDGHVASALAAAQMHAALSEFLRPCPGIGVTLGDTSNLRPDLVQIAADAFRNVAIAVIGAQCGRDSGTTGTLVLLREWECVIAHVGDSAAMVLTRNRFSRACRPRFVTDMHRPTARTEAARIEKAGGILVEGYVVDQITKNKGISITRTLGDVDMTINGCISEPEIKSLILTERDRVIVIASDGLWDTKGISFENVGRAVSKARGNAQIARQVLFAQVENSGGASDDCTVAVITLQQ